MTTTPKPSPLAELLFLAIPTVAQMASYTLMQFIDTWMASRLGVAAPAATGTAGIFAFSLISLGFGSLFVVNTLVSQSFGKRDFPHCGRYLWQGLWLSIFFWLLVLPFIPLASHIFLTMGHEPTLVSLESSYFRLVVGASIFKLAQLAIGQFLLAINRPRAVLLATVCGVTVNAIAAYYFVIYKAHGSQPVGVRGAAIAQNIGNFVELLLTAIFAFTPYVRKTYHTLDFRLRLVEMSKLVRMGVPSGVQTLADVLAWGLFSAWVIGQFGTPAITANTFIFRYMSVGFMPTYGIASAVTALVGRYIGAGRPDLASQRAHLGFWVAAIYMLLCGSIYILARHPLLAIFSDTPEVLRIGAQMMIFAGIYQFFDAMYIVYNAALRGAGDTFIPALATLSLCWTLTVAGGYTIGHLYPHFGPAGPWTVATIYGILLGLFMLYRFTTFPLLAKPAASALGS